jgi:hypothetical protein
MIEVAHKLVLSNSHVKDWVPNSKIVGGLEFVELNQWDRRFHRFCTGKYLTFPKGQSHKAHTQFMDYLVDQRTACSRQVFEAARQALQEAAIVGGAPNVKKRVRACRMADSTMAGDIVDCNLEYLGVRILMKVLFGIKNQKLWIEATSENLQWVAAGIKHDYEAGIVSPLGHSKIRGSASAAMEDAEQAQDAEQALEDDNATSEDAGADVDSE